MSDGFDRLSRSLARPDRRTLLKSLGAAVALVVVAPFRGSAARAASCPSGTTPCGPNCCQGGVACLDQSKGVCGCTAGRTKCGETCCKGTCSNAATSCCCAAGQTPCGSNCCPRGVACVDASTGSCGCPAGTTPCRQGATLTCCPAGQACKPGCPPANTGLGCSCRVYADSCTSNEQCCSGFCSSFKSDHCGCVSNGDCPSSAPYCDHDTGICSS